MSLIFSSIFKSNPYQWSRQEWSAVHREFNRQITAIVGGFCNPIIESVSEAEIVFRCFYDGYDNEEDSWHWILNRETGVFFN